ncbi:M16 family metallopeptidase [Janibacter sp. G56]|uniref:M16 family metallopeptidase n=1 Tax=Janibacter sp. G56 TaxID=3418717 RepID=UPI003D0026AD
MTDHPDTFPTRPEVTPPADFVFPEPSRHTLANGMTALVHDVPGQLVISVRTAFALSLAWEPRDREGVASLMARLLDEGTLKHSAAEFAELLERRGVAIGAGISDAGLGVDMDVPVHHLGDALDLLTEALSIPAFAEDEVRRMKRTRLAEIAQERASAPHRAAKELAATYYDPAERASRPSAGTPDTVEVITREDIAAFHAAHVRPSGATVVVAGDVGQVDIVALLERTLGTWSPEATEPRPMPEEAQRRATDAARVVLVDRPGSVQSEISIAGPGPDRTIEAGWAPFPVLGFIVGGSPNARIDAVLREEKGYTYGIRSGFRPRRRGGLFVTSGSVRADATIESVQLLVDILAGGRDGFTEAELVAGVDFISKTAPARFETADAIADESVQLALEGLPADFTTDNLRRIRALGSDDLQRAWDAYVTGEWTVIVVGDAATLREGLEGLGIGPVTVVPN